jgi:uncharacterized peroxidase-related enzyme
MMADDGETLQFLPRAAVGDAARGLFDEDLRDCGFVMNVSRLWAYQPEALTGLFDLMAGATSARPFTSRERGILVAACASAVRNSYCSLAWGTKLAALADPQLAAAVLRGDDDGLSPGEQAMAAWARRIAREPSRTQASDVADLRDAGFSDADIFAMTVFVALRVAFSTVNDALGAHPDAEFRAKAPAEVLSAVTYGRPIASQPG